MSADKEHAISQNSWWGRHFGYLSAEAKAWFWLVLLLLVCGGFYLGFWYSCQQPNPITVPYVTADNYVPSPEADPQLPRDYFGNDGVMTVLLLGCDMRDGEAAGRSDTIMLAFVNMESKAINLLSIPRDTRVELAEGKGTTKINHAFAYGGVNDWQADFIPQRGLEAPGSSTDRYGHLQDGQRQGRQFHQ